MLKRVKWIGLLALAVAWSFDFLFWKKQPGISFAIFILLCLAAGLMLAWIEGKRPATASLLLILPLAFFAGMSFIRIEPFTLAFNYLMALGLMGLMAITFLGGRWFLYCILDYVVGAIKLTGSVLTGVILFWEKSTAPKPTQPETSGLRRANWKPVFLILRGILVAAPVVAIFAALLASADPIFSRRLADIVKWFNLDNLPEYIWRLCYILALAYGLAGVYLHVLLHSQDERLIGQEKPWLAPFLGFTEAAVVLASVSLLFASFVVVQLQYFFGGKANITVEGFTYAEYARRGFGELVAVALFSLMLLLALNAVTRRPAATQRWGFSGLTGALVTLVTIILVSAFQRLLLYEQAYGFTRLRTLIHIFMVWLGILLVATLILELTRRMRIFPAAVLLAVLGFGVTLNSINVDGLIVRQNVERTRSGLPLDSAYLMNLSADAVPALVSLYKDPALPKEIHTGLVGPLACQAARLKEETKDLAWQSFNLSRSLASRSLQGLKTSLPAYSVRQDEYNRWFITIGGSEQLCFSGNMD
jgi:hypothetical protein